MSALRPLAIARDYSELHAALRAHVVTLETTCEGIDYVSGLQSGYSSKLLAPTPIRNLGVMSLGAMLQTVGLVLIVAVDVELVERMRERLPRRQRPQIPSKQGATA